MVQAQEAAQRLASAITGLSSLTRLNGTPLPTPTSVAAAGGLLDLSGSPLGPIAGKLRAGTQVITGVALIQIVPPVL